MARITEASNSLTSPAWAGDFLNREHLLPGGAKLLASAFLNTDAVVATVGAAAAAQGATSIPVAALSGAIPNGTVLYFSATEYAKLTAAAAAGATSLTVEALVNALEEGDSATYSGVGIPTVVSGTLVGRTFTERAAGTAFGPAADGDDEVYLVAFDVHDVSVNNDVDLYRHGGIVKENFLPVFSALSSTLQGKIRTAYQTTRGVN
jgi:hypothetical protein